MAMVSSAHTSLPSPPRPEVDRMFFTRVGTVRSPPNPSGANRGAGLREINEEEAAADSEPEEEDGGGGKLYVVVGKDLKDGRSNLLWAARNLLACDLKLVLLHVHQPVERIMTGLCKVSASHVEEKELKAYRKIEEEMNTLLNQYLNFCSVSLKVQAETLVIEKKNPASGVVDLIDQHHIKTLAMGASSVSMKRKVPKSKVATIVHLQAKPYCHIFYICKATLAFSREATQLSAKGESTQSCCASSVSDQPEFPPRSLSLPQGHPGFLGSTDHQALQRPSNSVTCPLSGLVADTVENMSATRPQSIDMSPTGFYLNSSQQSTGGSSWGLKDLDSMDGSPHLFQLQTLKNIGAPWWKLSYKMKCLSNCTECAMS